MPEGPEHHFAAKLINETCCDRVFHGEVEKSELATNAAKHPDFKWKVDQYRISACSRGKEIKLTLTAIPACRGVKLGTQLLSLVFQFGMSGSFKWSTRADIPKHAHLRFFSKAEDSDEKQVLCFHDPRRFGRWRVGDAWSDDRGPDPVNEYELFRDNVKDNLANAVFKRPICEVLLNQKYFNGVGNYLRAEILYRAGIAPFERASDVFDSLQKLKNNSDILHVCSIVMREALDLYDKPGKDYTYIYTGEDETFYNWVQCYSKSNMKSLVDSNRRTIWFHGNAGPLAPKRDKKVTRKVKRTTSNVKMLSQDIKDLKKIKEEKQLESKDIKKNKKEKQLESKDIKKIKKEKQSDSKEVKTGPVTRSRQKKNS